MFHHLFSVNCSLTKLLQNTRFTLNSGMFLACNDTISNCEECYQEESNTTCTRCGQQYYTFDGSDCTGESHNWGQSTLFSHTYVL